MEELPVLEKKKFKPRFPEIPGARELQGGSRTEVLG